MSGVHRGSSLLLCLTVAGCYRYVPSGAVQPSLGDDVRFTLSPEATARLVPVLGAGTKTLTGRIVADAGGEFALAVDRTFKEDGAAVVWAGDRVTIPRTAIVLSEHRELDRRRTLVATGGVILGAVVSAFVISKSRANAGESGTSPPRPPPP